jgi:signal transduction histidine kinase
MSNMQTSLEDLIGIEHSKLGFFQELRHKLEEIKRSNQELEDQRREILAILDGITDLMMVLSEDLRIISVNHVFREMIPDPEPEGKYCYTIFRGEDHPCPECPAFRSLASNSVCRATAIFKLSDRNMRFDMVASPLKNPDWPQHRVLIFKRDVTLEKEYQAKFYQAEKMATIGVLAAGVAHEVNNPLAAVVGFAEGIKRRLPQLERKIDGELFGDLKEYTDTILKECLRCRDIVKTLLTFSRHAPASLSLVALNSVVSDTLRLLQHELSKRSGIQIKMELEENLPVLKGNEAQLKQVVLNLLTNALDAIKDSGCITVRTFLERGARLCLEIRDTGCGIPPEHLDKLFEPFFTTKPVGKGIGIGLSTCYNIVHDHGGSIQVSSNSGQGSSFTVVLPLSEECALEESL